MRIGALLECPLCVLICTGAAGFCLSSWTSGPLDSREWCPLVLSDFFSSAFYSAERFLSRKRTLQLSLIYKDRYVCLSSETLSSAVSHRSPSACSDWKACGSHLTALPYRFVANSFLACLLVSADQSCTSRALNQHCFLMHFSSMISVRYQIIMRRNGIFALKWFAYRSENPYCSSC